MIVHGTDIRITVIFHFTVGVNDRNPQIIDFRIIIPFYILQKILSIQKNMGMAFQVSDNLILKFPVKNRNGKHHRQAHTQHSDQYHSGINFPFHLLFCPRIISLLFYSSVYNLRFAQSVSDCPFLPAYVEES